MFFVFLKKQNFFSSFPLIPFSSTLLFKFCLRFFAFLYVKTSPKLVSHPFRIFTLEKWFFGKMSGVLDEGGMAILSEMRWFLDSPTIVALLVAIER